VGVGGGAERWEIDAVRHALSAMIQETLVEEKLSANRGQRRLHPKGKWPGDPTRPLDVVSWSHSSYVFARLLIRLS